MSNPTPTHAVLRELREEALNAGDISMATDCEAALSGDSVALAHCATVLANARAMDDTDLG